MVNFTIIASGYATALSAFSFNTATNKLSLLSTTPTDNSPSWLQTGATPGSLFAALEIAEGGIESFTIGADGSLTSVSQVQTRGIPVSLAVLTGGKEVVTANYDTGLVVSCAIEDDGVTLGACVDGATLEGSGPVAERQDKPHAHQIVEHNDEILIADLGSDMVWRLAKDADSAWQIAGAIPQAPGSGPRHLVATEDKLFVLHELDNSLTAYTLPDVSLTPPPATTPQPEEPAATPNSAKFRYRRKCSTPAPPTPSAPETPTETGETEPEPTHAPGPALPPVTPPVGEEGAQLLGNFSILAPNLPAGSQWAAAELILSPDGQYLYASNRNTGTADAAGDSIAIFTVEPFALVGHVATGLTHLRAVVLGGENGEYLIAAGQVEGGVKIYSRGEDGQLTELDHYDGEGSEKITTFAWAQ